MTDGTMKEIEEEVQRAVLSKIPLCEECIREGFERGHNPAESLERKCETCGFVWFGIKRPRRREAIAAQKRKEAQG